MNEAVLLLAYGSPSLPEDMADYLRDVREGREPPPELIAEMQERQRRIGGSPLTRLTLAQALALQRELLRRGRFMPVYVGMRHWPPRIADAIAQMRADGITDAVALVMAPHYSALSGGRYRQRVEEAQAGAEAPIRFRFIESWWAQPRLLDAWESAIRRVLAAPADSAEKPAVDGEAADPPCGKAWEVDPSWEGPRPRGPSFGGGAAESIAAAETGKTKLIFTAQSLPARIRQAGDPYEEQLLGNCRALAERLGTSDWTFAFQSAGASPEPWLGPALEDVLPTLARDGYRRVLGAPIGFVCDHMEILFDLDMEARGIAESAGLQFARVDLPNTAPLFIEALADTVLAARDGSAA